MGGFEVFCWIGVRPRHVQLAWGSQVHRGYPSADSSRREGGQGEQVLEVGSHAFVHHLECAGGAALLSWRLVEFPRGGDLLAWHGSAWTPKNNDQKSEHKRLERAPKKRAKSASGCEVPEPEEPVDLDAGDGKERLASAKSLDPAMKALIPDSGDCSWISISRVARRSRLEVRYQAGAVLPADGSWSLVHRPQMVVGQTQDRIGRISPG